jgi:hypothetical protein
MNYYNNCVNIDRRELDDLLAMIHDHATEITYAEFMAMVDEEQVKKMFPFYTWPDGPDGGLTLEDDYAVAYYKSMFQGEECCFIEHSAIEYIFR